ncbi:MAG: hypothetical protein ABFR97_02520 [Thermodesulfobacteriota bacterium]
MKSISWLMLAAFVVSGCAHRIDSSPAEIDQSWLDNFAVKGAVEVYNDQYSTGRYLVRSKRLHKWYINLKQVTETAIVVLEDELLKRGQSTEVARGGEKALYISVVSVTYDDTGFGRRTVVALEGSTGKDERVKVTGENFSAEGLGANLDAAVSLAVVSLLNEEIIRDYLEE